MRPGTADRKGFVCQPQVVFYHYKVTPLKHILFILLILNMYTGLSGGFVEYISKSVKDPKELGF